MLFQEKINLLYAASQDKNRIQGLTHNFYRYPARFSPIFARTAIELFSKPGDIVLDPYMGGGTTVIEAMTSGRRAIGVDLNALACFIATVKTTGLKQNEKTAIISWAEKYIPKLNYHGTRHTQGFATDESKMKNLELPKARFLKKVIGTALFYLNDLPTKESVDFVRCAILKTAQGSLDGQKSHTTVSRFRENLSDNIKKMLNELEDFEKALPVEKVEYPNREIFERDASLIDSLPVFKKNKVDLVVTSPPYPGLHILYHRWQVDGRKETPAPYWITGTSDGQGDSFYNFGSRHQPGFHKYFEASFNTLKAIRSVMKPGAHIVQMIAFSKPEELLPRYLSNMVQLGFKEVLTDSLTEDRIWRDVPNRKWHAALRGNTQGSKEVVLIHVV